MEFGRTTDGRLHILHLVHDTPLCRAEGAVVARSIGLLQPFSWNSSSCARCLRLAYEGEIAPAQEIATTRAV